MSAPANFLQRKPLPEARSLLLAQVVAVGEETVAVENAVGRVTADTVIAAAPAPHYRASAMDGIAVRSADTWAAADAPVVLPVVSAEAAEPAGPACVAVDTGSLLPDWTDAVVRVEETASVDGGFRIKSPVPPGCDVRRAGEDIETGTVLLAAGSRIRPFDLGAMLATGITTVRVRRRPRVAILATGAEVVEPADGAGPGQVIEYNSRVIAALVQEWGGSAHRLGLVADDEASLARAVADAASRFDVVAVIAGSSAGRKDFTVAVLASLGEVFVHGVDIAPGRPVAMARVGSKAVRQTPVIAVPGYPVAAIVVCERLLRPLLASLLGAAEEPRASLVARLARKIPSRLGMEEFRRVCLARQSDGTYVVASLPSGAGSISTATTAHGWLRIASTEEGLDAGSNVTVELRVSVGEIDAALVVAGSSCPASAQLEASLRRSNLLTRIAHLRLAAADALAAVERGEAHAAFVSGKEAAAASAPLRVHALPDSTALLVVVIGSAADNLLSQALRQR